VEGRDDAAPCTELLEFHWNFPSSFLFCFEFSHVFSLSYPFSALGLVLAIFTELFHEERKWQHDTHLLFPGRVEWSWICFPFFGDGAVERGGGDQYLCACMSWTWRQDYCYHQKFYVSSRCTMAPTCPQLCITVVLT